MLNNNSKKIFDTLINESIKNLEMISDVKDRTLVMTEICKALALGGFSNEIVQDPELTVVPKNEVKEEPVEEVEPVKEEPVKEEPVKEEAPVEEEQPVQEEPVNEAPEEPIKPSEDEVRSVGWTQETVQQFMNEIGELKKYATELGGEKMTALVSDFSHGILTNGIQDIGPTNIQAFLVYIDKIRELM